MSLSNTSSPPSPTLTSASTSTLPTVPSIQTLPFASTSTLPSASTSTLPSASTSTLPSASTQTLPSASTLPTASTQTLPSASTSTLPSASTSTLPSAPTSILRSPSASSSQSTSAHVHFSLPDERQSESGDDGTVALSEAVAVDARADKLGAVGLTASAYSFIAPGAFLWITFQMQAAGTSSNGGSSAVDAWAGLLLATIVAVVTALPMSELAGKFHHAGSGGPYYFCDKSLGYSALFRYTRLAKCAVSSSLTLFYWLYPGIFLSFFVTLVTGVTAKLAGDTSLLAAALLSLPGRCAVAAVSLLPVTYFVLRGAESSAPVAYFMCVLQTAALLCYSAVLLAFRWFDPLSLSAEQWSFSSALDVLLPHSLHDTLQQCVISMLLLVGFESATAMADAARSASRDIPRAVLLSLGLSAVAFALEYFATLYAANARLTAVDDSGQTVAGLLAMAASSTPIGDLLHQVVAAITGLHWLAAVLRNAYALVVIVALLGAILAVMNTSARITSAVSLDSELPALLSRTCPPRYTTPVYTAAGLAVFTALLAVVGSSSVTLLTIITLTANIGVFLLYAITCLVCTVAFVGKPQFSVVRHAVLPVLGAAFNLAMLANIVVACFTGPSTLQSRVAWALALLWLVAWFVYFVVHSRQRGVPLLVAERDFFQHPAELDCHSLLVLENAGAREVA